MPKNIEQIQLVLFSPGIVITNKPKLVSDINDALQGLFDGDPAILPIPEDAPAEIPRIILKSRDERYIFQIATKRVNFFYNYRPEDSLIEFPINGLYDKFIYICKSLIEEVHCQFPRAAQVTRWAIELPGSGAEYILSTYLREDALFKDPYDLELHCLTKENVAGCKTNKWVRIKSARKASDPSENNLLTVLIDINTIAEEEYEFGDVLLTQFLNRSSNITKETISAHFIKKE
ncbi:MAG: hypothetical protein JRI26_10150 [Deltaproteobacteria bacterium]|nr:hypothetical protein [Deltaproteobacteria bacterium]